ncbi:MAG: substrate-binding domain-containing protein [Verrucomicrobiales bacterium]|nr:substrate-binding domain-containing protein [Verrucomicrobiota bacterium JB025]
MTSVRILSAVEQVTDHLRDEIVSGALAGTMPGVGKLAKRLGVSPKTVIPSLAQLEQEGLVEHQGPRKRRRIVCRDSMGQRPMSVAILLYEPSDIQLPYLIKLQHGLMEAGHTAFCATKTLTELKMDATRVERLVNQTNADAWVVVAGSTEILGYFSKKQIPVFALFGRRASLPIASAGPNTAIAFTEATRHLISLGHRRIVRICRIERRKPRPGLTERSFLDELAAHNIPIGSFNLPDWEETAKGLHALLVSLFEVTPPTALMVDEAPIFFAVMQFIGSRGLQVPRDVSLVCGTYDPHFAWCVPSVAHLRWDSQPLLQRMLRWATSVSRGIRDQRFTIIPAEFVLGGTVGPAPAE